jgi:hypothetical protein
VSWKVSDPLRYVGRTFANGHCVRFVQIVGDMPHTSMWRRGQKVRGGGVSRGTVVATFGEDGRYENRIDGHSHAAILLDQGMLGLNVVDQWQGHPVAERMIRFKGGEGKPVNDGDMFYVVESSEPSQFGTAA